MNTARTALVSLAVAATLALGGTAHADVNSDLGPEANTYTVKGVSGSKSQGFFVRYYNGDVKYLSPIKSALRDADDKAERLLIRSRYAALAEHRDLLTKFGANDLF